MGRAKRTNPDVRREEILKAAIEEAKDSHYLQVTREKIAKRVGVTDSVVNAYFGTMSKLRRDLMRYAVANSCVEIVAQGLANKDPHAQKANDAVRAMAAAMLLTD